MPEYPQHILDRAAEYHEAIVKDGPESAIHHIARAIVEQARKDAQLAFWHKLKDNPNLSFGSEMNAYWLGQEDAATEIENAIRNRVTQEE